MVSSLLKGGFKIKKIIVLGLVLVLVSLLSVGVFGKTDVVGVIYESDHETPVEGADVNIKCYDGDNVLKPEFLTI